MRLLIFRSDWPETKEITIVRDLIEVPSLDLEIKEIDGEKIAYLSIYQFSENTAYNFNSYAYEIMESGANKIILDLRDNPGGYLEVAQAVAGWFLEKGQLVVTEDFSNDEEDMKYLSEGPSGFSDYPMVVLINEGSASASEILAGALRDDRNIQLIGEKIIWQRFRARTFGFKWRLVGKNYHSQMVDAWRNFHFRCRIGTGH